MFSEPVFSPDGRYLSFVLNHTLYVTDARTGDTLIQGHMDETRFTPSLSYSADGEYLFVSDQSLYIVDAQGRLYTILRAEDAAPYNNAVQLGERMLITTNAGEAFLCCTPAASSVRTAAGEEIPALCESYDPHAVPADERLLVLSGEHELTEGFRQSTALTDLTAKLWFSPDGQRAALSYADGVIELFDAPDGGAVSTMLGQLTREITALAMTEDRLIASDGGGRLMFYDLKKGEVIRILNTDFSCLSFAFSAERDKLMALRADGAIDVYALEGPEKLFTMRSAEGFTGLGFAADGSCAVGLTDSGALCAELWTDEDALLAFAADFTGR